MYSLISHAIIEDCSLSWAGNLKWPKKGQHRYLTTTLKAVSGNTHGDLQWLGCWRWMQLSFPPDSRQDKKYSLMNSINCIQPRSIGQSSAQSLSPSVMLPTGEAVAHKSRLVEVENNTFNYLQICDLHFLVWIKWANCLNSCDVLIVLLQIHENWSV